MYNTLLYKYIKSLRGAVVIEWLLNLELPMQSVPIITNVVSSNPTHGEV